MTGHRHNAATLLQMVDTMASLETSGGAAHAELSQIRQKLSHPCFGS